MERKNPLALDASIRQTGLSAQAIIALAVYVLYVVFSFFILAGPLFLPVLTSAMLAALAALGPVAGACFVLWIVRRTNRRDDTRRQLSRPDSRSLV